MLSALALLPFAYAAAGRKPPAAVMVRTFATSQLVFGAAAAAGLGAGAGLGLGAPLLEAALRGERIGWTGVLPVSVAAGVALPLALWLVDVGLFTRAHATLRATQVKRGVLLRLGAAFYGAVAEEVLMRLGLLTILAWVMARLWSLMAKPWPDVVLASAVLLSTIVFALGHTGVGRGVRLARGLMLRSLVLNGLAGLVFGTLYVLRGLEAAIVSHATTDLLVVVLLPSLRGRRRNPPTS